MSPCPKGRSNPQQPSTADHNSYCSTEQQESESSKSDKLPSPPPPSDVVAGDDEKLEMICPVCREFNAATLTAVNAHIDGCLAESVREERRHMKMMNSKATKSIKSKSPKKRSIAEIFKDKHKDQVQEEEVEEDRAMKLWPLPEDVVDDEVSITVRKFRWLSQRLEALRSKPGGVESVKSSVDEEKLEMICPVCRDFNAATVTAVNAHIDSCLAQAVRDERRQTIKTGVNFKSKPKAPKKRSIAEILNAAPPIQAINSKTKAIEVEEDEDKFSDYSGDDSSASDAAATFVSIRKSKKSLNKNSKKKKTKNNKSKKKMMMMKRKLGKDFDSGVLLNNEKKTDVNMKKKKKKKNIFNSEVNGKKVCDLCLMKYKLIFSLYALFFNYLKLIHGYRG
jgi:ribosomal protein L44E